MTLNLNENQKQLLVSAFLSVLILAAGLIGYAVKPAPAAPAGPTFNAQGVTNFDSLTLGSNLTVGGTVSGKVLQYPTPARKMVCGESSITGTGTIAHGLSTPEYVTANLATDSTGAIHHVSTTNASATVTLKVWTSALTPAASGSAANVDWCVVGVP